MSREELLVNSTHGIVRLPEVRDVRFRPAERVYYNRGGILVTERSFVSDEGVYAVAHLNRLRTGRGPVHPMVPTTFAIAVVFLSAFAVSGPVLFRRPVAWLAVLAVAVVPVVVAVFAVRFQRRPYQIWADYRGEAVLVFSTLDEKTYGHVCRALIRARESCPPEAPGGPGRVTVSRQRQLADAA
jgi:hypothetical protein